MTIDKHCTARRLADHSEAAIRLMREYEIEPNPNNYRLWFTYATGENKKLNQTINVLLSNKREISPIVCDDLYYQFFHSLDEVAQLANVTTDIESQLVELVSTLSSAGLVTSKFGRALEGASKALNVYPDAEHGLRPIVNLLVTATRQMEKRNQVFQIRLQKSSEQISDLKSTIETIHAVSVTDQLTEIGNRRSFDDHLREYAMHGMETGESLCLLLLDIDKFKNFNDTWGHPLGDQVLRLFASCLQQTVGSKGFCARYGGEEFAVLLPNIDIPNAVTIANAIRKSISRREIVNRSNGQKVGTITVSIGVAQFAQGEPLTSLIERADAGLYAAKENGRNRVVCENEL
ncbi:unnamed protein product, partial [Phaeothamnion confervicola]